MHSGGEGNALAVEEWRATDSIIVCGFERNDVRLNSRIEQSACRYLCATGSASALQAETDDEKTLAEPNTVRKIFMSWVARFGVSCENVMYATTPHDI